MHSLLESNRAVCAAALPVRARRPFARAVAAGALLAGAVCAQAQTPLADQPPFSSNVVPGNLAMPLSVEFPTAVSVANIANYGTAREFLGYFVPSKCYAYHYDVAEANRYFYSTGTTTTRTCNNAWSGSFLNWATMQTIDPFRKVLTGGLRTTDTATTTIIEKAWASGQGGAGNFPNRTLNAGVNGATPFGWTEFRMRIQGLGNRMRFSGTGNVDAAPTAYDPSQVIDPATTYEVSVRVRVCDTPGADGLPDRGCVAYGTNYKPEGLIQQYSDRIRYSVFGYLNDSNIQRDGGVLRARQKFVGPMTPRPGLPALANASREWDPTTGVFATNPDAADAAATGVTNSGVINYLNKFGQSGSYKTYDPVGELYYAAIRYFKNLGNVPEWSSGATTTQLDGFPVITNWDDPIQYSCQRNFILGIGDVNTHADKNVPGPTSGANEPAKPGAVAADTTVNAVADTDRIGQMEGLGNLGSNAYPYCCSNNAAFMAGLAYDAHTRDIRPDLPNAPNTIGQTITTYWLDVLEYQTYRSRNQYWLATKYGGFRVPTGYDPSLTNAAPANALWNTGGARVPTSTDLKPDNYFTATEPREIEDGLTRAFADIAANLRATTTSFSTALPQVTPAGTSSFSAQYNAEDWSGEIEASTLTYPAPDYTPTLVRQWLASERLALQLAGAGWDANRRVVTWDGAQGVAFRSSGPSAITPAQLATLDTSYVTDPDGPQFLNYLRGERTNENNQPGTPLGYRPRVTLLGDIVNSKVSVVGAPALAYSDTYNPGYGAFRAANQGRTTMVYVGANDGMLHAFEGSAASTAGTEVFAYVPSALFNGPNNTPNVDGLAALGSPSFVHHYYVDGLINVTDIDLARTGGPITGSPAPNWRSVLIGGLGKGGRSYYAIDVTNPAGMTNEANVAANVLWEFPNANTPAADRALFGYSYGQAIVTKTEKWGWVVVFASGYNNADGRGHLFFVNPANGTLLERMDTFAGTPAAPAGLAHVQMFSRNYTDSTAESIYAGDLLGNVWRFDVRGTGVYQSANNPTLIATATASNGSTQPITSKVRVAVHPRDNRRYVMFGTGRLLAVGDLGDTQPETFYVISDGTQGAFNTQTPVNTLPTGLTFPITRANLVQNTTPRTGITADASRPMGWLIELGGNVTGVGWRVINQADVFYTEVAFASIVPGNDACSPGGNSRIYALDFSTGQSVLQTTSNGAATRIDFSTAVAGIVTDLRYVNRNGTQELTAGGSGGGLSNIERVPLTGTGLRRLNWRELPSPPQ